MKQKTERVCSIVGIFEPVEFFTPKYIAQIERNPASGFDYLKTSIGRPSRTQIQYTAAANPPKSLEQLNRVAPEHLKVALFVQPATIDLLFLDNRRFSLAPESLGLPVDQICWPTLKADACGDKVIVRDVTGDWIPIDSATLRYLVDVDYATKIDKSIRKLQMSPAEQAESARLSMLARDPRWNDVGDEDDLFE